MERAQNRRDADRGYSHSAIAPPQRESVFACAWRNDVLAALIIVLLALVVAAPGIEDGGLGWSDAPNHTFDGIFVYELARQWPVDDPRAWAERFYLQFPSLGIIAYYPPGFAVIEALVFAVAGVSIAAARWTVLLHMIGAGWGTYALGKRWFDRPCGLGAAALFMTCPHGFLWANDVMLEWPATCWILATVYCYQRDREAPKARWAIMTAACLVMAFMIKQTAGFILPVLLLHAMLGADRRRYFLRPAWIGAASVSGAIIGAYFYASRPYAAMATQLLQWSFDVGAIPGWSVEILGKPLLTISVLGLLIFLVQPDRGPRGLLLIWFVVWTGFTLSITAKEPRYFFFSIPPLAFAAARLLWPGRQNNETFPHTSWKYVVPRLAAVVALVAAQTYLGRQADPGRLPRYDAAVAELVARGDADLVLVDAVRDGQFVFDVYDNPAARGRIISLRASKLLFARAGRNRYSYEQFVESPAAIRALLDRYGIRYILIESALPQSEETDADPPPRRMLRELLSGNPAFRMINSWPLKCGDPIWDHVESRLYEYTTCPPRKSDTIRLSFPSMYHEIEFDLPRPD